MATAEDPDLLGSVTFSITGRSYENYQLYISNMSIESLLTVTLRFYTIYIY